jgi:DNA-binding MarR family transcriptional regulator
MYATSEATAQKIAQALRQFHKAFLQFHRAEALQHFAGCKPSEIGVLLTISRGTKDGAHAMKVSEISKVMHVTSPTITQLLKGLEANRLVERHTDPADRRVVGIALTEQGEYVARRAEEIFLRTFQGLADYLGVEQSDQLASLLFKAVRYFQEKEIAAYGFVGNGDEEA